MKRNFCHYVLVVLAEIMMIEILPVLNELSILMSL